MKWVEENTQQQKKKQIISNKILILVAARSKAWVCGRSLAGFAASNPARSTNVCLLRVLCVVMYRSGRSLIQRSPTDCDLSVIAKLGQRGGPGPIKGFDMKK